MDEQQNNGIKPYSKKKIRNDINYLELIQISI